MLCLVSTANNYLHTEILLLLYLDEMSIVFYVLMLPFVITGTSSKPALLSDEKWTSPVSVERITVIVLNIL